MTKHHELHSSGHHSAHLHGHESHLHVHIGSSAHSALHEAVHAELHGKKEHTHGGHASADAAALHSHPTGEKVTGTSKEHVVAKVGDHIHHTSGEGSVEESPIRSQATSLLNHRDSQVARASSVPTSGHSDSLITPLKYTGGAVHGSHILDSSAAPTQVASTREFSNAGGGGGQLTDGSTDAHKAGKGADNSHTLDSSKPVSDLLKGGSADLKLVDKRSTANDQAEAQNKLKPGQTPSIEVQYQNQDGAKAPTQQPDFIVKKDGSVEVMHDPEKNPNAHIVVQVERDKGQVGDPTAAQKHAIDELVPYIADRVKNNPAYEQMSQGQVQVNDQQHLVSDAATKRIHNDVSHPNGQTDAPVPQVPHNVNNVSGRMGRVAGSGGAHESFGPHGDGTIPQRSVAPAMDNTPPVQAVEDTVAALAGADKHHPYSHVSQRSDGSYGVGRYGLNHANMAGWLSGMLGIDLGDPPDYSKLEQYLKDHPEAGQQLEQKMQDMAHDHKVPQKFADQFKDSNFTKGFLDNVQKLDGKHGQITSADVDKYMPKELQETVAQDRVQQYAKQMGIDTNNMQDQDPGKLALSMYLGRPATAQDQANPGNQNYENAANNMYKFARAGQFTDGRIDVSEDAGKIVATAASKVGQQVWAQTKWANAVQGGNLGCAASISKILEDSGALKPGEGSAGVEGLADVLAKHGWQRIPITDKSQYRPGDVVYGTAGSGHGHIGLIGEVTNGQVWEYDNSSSKTTLQHRTVESGGSFVPIDNGRSRFGRNLYVMRAPSDSSNN